MITVFKHICLMTGNGLNRKCFNTLKSWHIKPFSVKENLIREKTCTKCRRPHLIIVLLFPSLFRTIAAFSRVSINRML
ncbi:hypothetical protein F383_17476 [Gossypium arboreum]|uniref:Uncharacterized protein n=1 Tax=Gossypium arboreum TaxID=29729 RepID=A0A0B0NK60_GOSAR|nr:hypothetical protein F383_17476 [Gossypium arboreum]